MEELVNVIAYIARVFLGVVHGSHTTEYSKLYENNLSVMLACYINRVYGGGASP
jgi:hypothetical protein